MATLNDCFEDAMSFLDFNKIRSVMKFLDWKYYNETEIPSEEKLKKVCKELFDEACITMIQEDCEGACAATGGFIVNVKRYKNDKGNYSYSCMFAFAIEDVFNSTEELEECENLNIEE